MKIIRWNWSRWWENLHESMVFPIMEDQPTKWLVYGKYGTYTGHIAVALYFTAASWDLSLVPCQSNMTSCHWQAKLNMKAEPASHPKDIGDSRWKHCFMIRVDFGIFRLQNHCNYCMSITQRLGTHRTVYCGTALSTHPCSTKVETCTRYAGNKAAAGFCTLCWWTFN